MPEIAEPPAKPSAAHASKQAVAPARHGHVPLGSLLFVAAYLGLCFLAFATLIVSTWLDVLAPVAAAARSPFRLYAYIFCAGGLGAVVYCIRGFYKHVSIGDYSPSYVYWYIFRPWIGTVLGMVSYLLIVGGLMVFESGTPASGSLRGKALFLAIAFLAGFSSNEFIMKMNTVSKAIFGVDGQGEPDAGSTGKPGAPAAPKPPDEP